MDRLILDTAALREAGSALRVVALEFEAANTYSEEVAEAIGHRGLAGAVRAFAHDWDGRRGKMLAGIAKLAQATTGIGEGFEAIDAELGGALRGEGPGAARLPSATAVNLPGGSSGPQWRPASRRTLDWGPLADADPVRGDPDLVADAARRYGYVADAIATSASRLRALGELGQMHSAAVDAVRSRAREVAEEVARAEERYRGAGSALAIYAAALTFAQQDSLTALRQAKAAVDSLATAAVLTQGAQARIATSAAGADTATDTAELRRAATMSTEASAELASARALVVRAAEDRDRAAERAERMVNDTRKSGGLNDSFWDDAKELTIGLLKAVSIAADVIAAVAGILSLLTIWCPPLSAALAGVATWAAVVSLAAKSILLMWGEASVLDVAISALAVATFGLGKAAIGGFHVSAAGARGAARVAAGRWAARSPAARAAAGLADDADSATAIAKMLGTTEEIGTRAAARAAAQNSLDHGFKASAANIGRNLRGIPATASDDVKAFWNADLLAANQQFKAAGGIKNPFNLMGEVDAATGLQRVFKIDTNLLVQSDVLPHVIRTGAHASGAFVAYGTGLELLRQEGKDLYGELMNGGSSSARTLNLPGRTDDR